METLIKRKVDKRFISGAALKAQRESAGLSQRDLAALITIATGQVIYHQKISRWENLFEIELEPVMAFAVQKILIR